MKKIAMVAVAALMSASLLAENVHHHLISLKGSHKTEKSPEKKHHGKKSHAQAAKFESNQKIPNAK